MSVKLDIEQVDGLDNYVDLFNDQSIFGVKKFTGFYTSWLLHDDQVNNSHGFAQSHSSGFFVGTLNNKPFTLYQNSNVKVEIHGNTTVFHDPISIPSGFNINHAVNLGQLNSAVSSVKTRIGINGSNYTDAGDINLIANSGVILNKVGNNIYIESTGTPHSSKMTNEVNFPDFTTIELNTDKHYIYCDNSYNFSEITIDVGQAKDGYELIIFCGEDPNVGQNPYIIMNADVIRPNGQEYDTILLSRGKWYRFIYFKDLDKLMLSGYGEV